MTQKQTLTGLIILVAASLLIAGCSGAPSAQPTATVDTNVIVTQAAQTVQAGMALTEAAKPTIAPTNTPAPTNTMDPVMAVGLTQTAQAVLQPGAGAQTTPGTPAAQPTVAGQPTAAKTPVIALPTATTAAVAPAPKSTGDKAELAGQSPADGSTVQKSASFDAAIVLKNTGTTTWTTGYQLVFYAGDKMGSPNGFNMPHEVKPGETVRLEFTMTASDSEGKKRTIWAVQNADGVNFYSLWLDINVEG